MTEISAWDRKGFVCKSNTGTASAAAELLPWLMILLEGR